jgi:LSD1 subclass zinc finger protein
VAHYGQYGQHGAPVQQHPQHGPPQDLQCQSCGATLQLAPGMRTVKCPYCASPSVVERPHASGAPNPTFVLAFNLGNDAALEMARRWKTSRGIFTHSGVRNAPIADVRGIYVPAYLYGAVVHAQWHATIGENYTVTYKDASSRVRAPKPNGVPSRECTRRTCVTSSSPRRAASTTWSSSTSSPST